MNNHTLINADTDSIMIAKSDGSSWSKEEQSMFLAELNTQFPDLISWEHDGIFTRVGVFGSKNYALLPEGSTKIKTKGSSIRDTKKEPALREMMDKVINALIYDATMDDIVAIYKSYINEALNVKDIRRWCQKKTATKAIVNCKGHEKLSPEKKKVDGIRLNETVVWDAIKDEESIQEGDRFFLYPAVLSTKTTISELKNGEKRSKTEVFTGLRQDKIWSGDHDPNKLLQRVHDTMLIFESVIDTTRFLDYTLKRNAEQLKEFVV